MNHCKCMWTNRYVIKDISEISFDIFTYFSSTICFKLFEWKKRKLWFVIIASFKLDRFSLDDRLPQSLQSKVKISWIAANLRQERKTKTFVSRSEDGKIQGFSSLLLSKNSVIIDLIAVGPEFRNKGIASSLVRVSQEFAQSMSLPLEVGTQQTNPANRIYRKNGFILQSILHVSHDIGD